MPFLKESWLESLFLTPNLLFFWIILGDFPIWLDWEAKLPILEFSLERDFLSIASVALRLVDEDLNVILFLFATPELFFIEARDNLECLSPDPDFKIFFFADTWDGYELKISLPECTFKPYTYYGSIFSESLKTSSVAC